MAEFGGIPNTGLKKLRRASSVAVAVANAAPNNQFLDLIGKAEGTDRGRGYNETLGYGKFTGGPQNLTGMTIDQVNALQRQMLRHPANNLNSSALGRYQITRRTMKDLRKTMGLTGAEMFDPAMQDRMAMALMQRRGPNVAGLRNEWEGLRRLNPQAILAAYQGGGGQPMPPQVPPQVMPTGAPADPNAIAVRSLPTPQPMGTAMNGPPAAPQVIPAQMPSRAPMPAQQAPAAPQAPPQPTIMGAPISAFDRMNMTALNKGSMQEARPGQMAKQIAKAKPAVKTNILKALLGFL